MDQRETTGASLPFPAPLREGVILARPNRFIMEVALREEGAPAAAPDSGSSAAPAPASVAGSPAPVPVDAPARDAVPTPAPASAAPVPADASASSFEAPMPANGSAPAAAVPSSVPAPLLVPVPSSAGPALAYAAAVRCHCPVVSRIGGLDLAGRPCLVSDSGNPRRKLPLTVEAFSLDRPDAPRKRWIGINQNASNRYVEHFLRTGALQAVAGRPAVVRREVPLGGSRLDFLVDDRLYLEVKTPLVQIQTAVPASVPRLPEAPFSSTERSLRHLRELAASLADHERAVVLYCLYYENDGFRFYHGTTYDEVLATVDACRAAGVELWQADFEVTPRAVSLRRCFPLEEW